MVSDRPRTTRTLPQLLCHALPPIIAYRLSKYFLARETNRGEPFTARTITGSTYTHRRGDLLADSVRMCGFWDWRNIALAQRFCSPGDHIAEIGANTGTETLGFADVVGRDGTVFAFEPDATNADVLANNLDSNGYGHCSVRRAAVADRCGTLAFMPSRFDENSGMGHVWVSGDGATVDVPAVTVDSISDELARVTFFSIDVEGYEISVLRGAEAHLRRYRPVVVLEAHAEALERAGQSIAALHAALDALEYGAFEILRLDVRPVDLDTCGSGNYVRNWLCLPKERASEARRVRSTFLRWALMPRAALA